MRNLDTLRFQAITVFTVWMEAERVFLSIVADGLKRVMLVCAETPIFLHEVFT